ncbi:MAG: penicillin-binding protein, partial [Clostridia bacterium]|nr:penicillin-binding protein [Clostridia bacterium]
FAKKMYRYMIRDNELIGKEICMVMFEQSVIYGTASEKASLESGGITAYNYLIDKIKKLELTPAQLALDPCSASCVVTSTAGEVLACVTYPGYDNNKMANSIDAAYYNKLREDLSLPLYDYATQQRTAPGSTFKMVSAVAGLEEGVIDTSTLLTCHGIYEKVKPSPKCWIYPAAHGELNVVGGIQNSCNSFFYEVGYRLSTKPDNTYDAEQGLEKLAKYADMFGLSETSGIEIVENEPNVSDEIPIPSAIGQGTNNFTTVGLARYVNTVANGGTCYNLTLLSKETDSEGNVIKTYAPTIRNQVQIKESTWDAVHQGMRGVVQNAAVFDKVPMAIAGKTGTAQEKTTRANHALFVAYAPYEAPEITIATRIAFGYTSTYAAEISRDVIKYYFKLEDSDVLLSGEASEVSGTVIED